MDSIADFFWNITQISVGVLVIIAWILLSVEVWDRWHEAKEQEEDE